MEIEWLMFAKNITRNADGTRSILDVFDDMTVTGPPYYSEPFVMAGALRWGIDEIGTTKKLGIRLARFIEGEGLKPVSEMEIDCKIPDDILRWVGSKELLVQGLTLLFPDSGEYTLEVLADGEQIGRKEFKVQTLPAT